MPRAGLGAFIAEIWQACWLGFLYYLLDCTKSNYMPLVLFVISKRARSISLRAKPARPDTASQQLWAALIARLHVLHAKIISLYYSPPFPPQGGRAAHTILCYYIIISQRRSGTYNVTHIH